MAGLSGQSRSADGSRHNHSPSVLPYLRVIPAKAGIHMEAKEKGVPYEVRVIPAKAGIHMESMDSRLRGNDSLNSRE